MNDSLNVYTEINMNHQNEKKSDEENKNKNSSEKNLPKLIKKNLIKGPYILGEIIGEGNFATVRLATQIKIGEKLAIKIINKNKITKKSDIIRIKKEISILKKIRHKNIIQIYEVMESNQNVYIVMENCEGKELFEYIIKNNKLKEIEACRIFRQLINGVDYIHSQGIIHRDLKPENILLDENMDVKISDFGLSTFFSNGEYLSTPCGTPNYAPPEMLQGQEYDGEMSDIWSCGIILYSMLTGSLPCAESKEDIILNKIISNQYIIPSYLSHEAIDLLKSMLEPDFKKRIKIKDIIKHPWFNKCKNKLTPGIDIKNNEFTPIDENILKKMSQYGYDIDECRDNLLHMKNNSLTTVYYLLLKKFIQNKGQSIADLKSPAFLEYMKKNYSSENKNLYNKINYKNISEDNLKKKNYDNILINSELNKSCIHNNNTLGKKKNFDMNTKFVKHTKKKSQDISNLSLKLQKLNFNKDISFSKNNNKSNINSNTFNSQNNNFDDNNFFSQNNQYLYSNNFIKINNNYNINSTLNDNKDKKIIYKKKKTPDIKKNKTLEQKSNQNNQNKKNTKKIGFTSKLSINNAKKLKSSRKIKNNISNHYIINNPTVNNKKSICNFNNLTESLTFTSNDLNIFSSSIKINNASKDRILKKKKNKLKSISPKKKLIITHEEIYKEKNENLKNKNNKINESKNNISVIKMISNKIINYKINNSFEDLENIKNKNNYTSIQREDLKRDHYSQQINSDNRNIKKNITTERIFTETKKKKSHTENVAIDKSDSPINNSNLNIISTGRTFKKNIKQKNIKSSYNNNNKLTEKKYNNRYESSKSNEFKHIKKNRINSVSPQNENNKDLNNNFRMNNTNNSIILEAEKSEVESKDSKKVKNFKSSNKLLIKISNNNINRTKTDIKLKKEYGNKKLYKVNFNNDITNNNIVNDSIKEFKLTNNEKYIYNNKFSKRNISPITKNRRTLKNQTLEKNVYIKKEFKSKEKIKENEINVEFNKKYEAHTNRIIKSKNYNIINNSSNNNKNKDILNSKQNINIQKTFNNNLNVKKNEHINSSTLGKKKYFNKICHSRTGSGSDSLSFFSKIKIVSNKASNRRKQKDQFPEENGMHVKQLTSGNILVEYSNKTYNKSFNYNLKENKADLDIIVKNYSITRLIEKISNFLKKEKYNITKQINPNLHLLKCNKEGGILFHIEIIPLISKNNDIFYLKNILIKGDNNIFNEIILSLQKSFNS